jgi:hypothetical protein
METEWVAILVPGFFFAMIVLIVFFMSRGRARTAQIQAEVQTRMIERFASAPEFVNFLQSSAGRQFIKGFGDAPRAVAYDRILGGMGKGIVLAFLGAGFLGICFFEDARNVGFLIAGFVLLGLGAGFLVSTLVSIRLSRAWGLVPKASESPEQPLNEPPSSDPNSNRS